MGRATMLAAAALPLAFALGAAAPPAAAPEPRRLIVENRSGQPIFRLYVESVAAQCWCEDRLGPEVIEPAKQVTIDLGDGRGCRYDLGAVMKDGSRVALSGVDLCAARRWVVGPGSASSME